MKPRVATPEAIELFRRGAITLARISANGFRVDTNYVTKTRAELGSRILQKAEELREHDIWKIWKKHFGSEASLNKRKQLGFILFEVLKYPCREYTEHGKPKVDETAFDALSLTAKADDPTIQFLKKFIRLEKDKRSDGTFLKGIQDETVDGLLHTIFNLNIAESYRSTSDSPNLQNMPIRDKIQGEAIRRSFIPRWHHLLEIDFSGNEIKSSYCYHKDPTFYRDITTGDMHRDTAAEIFFLSKDKVSKDMRQAAKNKFVFPEFFGDYYINCAEGLWDEIIRSKLNVDGVDMREYLKKHGIKKLGSLDSKDQDNSGTFVGHIKKIENSFWSDRFGVYTEWKNQWWESYVAKGWCRMLTGFVVQGPYNRKQVINYPIQGAAFHWLLWSLIQIDDYLRKNKMKSLLVNQIHDSIILDVHKRELSDVIEFCVQTMTVAITKFYTWISAPMEVEVDLAPLGASWHFKEKYKHGN
jgi:DNA polymerase-1